MYTKLNNSSDGKRRQKRQSGANCKTLSTTTAQAYNEKEKNIHSQPRPRGPPVAPSHRRPARTAQTPS